jgi:1-deoxy-D-xylulose-5-phosphate reductoisomerase
LKKVTVLGSTGSIGVSTLDVLGRRRDEYQVFALVAGQNVEVLARQIADFRPQVAVVASDAILPNLIDQLSKSGLAKSDWPELLAGPAARVAVSVAPEVEFVMSAIVGVAGLEATYEATRLGKRIGLANKEVLVASGELVMQAARAAGTELLPVDSEHNGMHQCLRAGKRGEVAKLILTASGGPFRDTPAEAFEHVTPAQALKHPTWKMGQRITIDSATMMNKGFEVIEACWLFDFRADQVEVVVHPQSSVHAMVEYTDGSLIAQVSATDMRMPIQYALTFPAREDAPVPKMEWTQPRTWNFYPPDLKKFRSLALAYEAMNAGGSAPCILNAADEVAVQAFLDGQISFGAIPRVVEETLDRLPHRYPKSIAEVLEIDRQARAVAGEVVAEQTSTALSLMSTAPIS